MNLQICAKFKAQKMIFLAQTDTTAGFLSKDFEELNAAKKRPLNTPCVVTVSKFSELKNFARVPNSHKNLVRRAKKTTILYPNSLAVRVVKECEHAKFLDEFGYMYSTSANLHGQDFDLEVAKNIADFVVDDEFSQNQPSKILKISQNKIKKIR